MHTILVDDKVVSVRGRVEYQDGILSVPNNRSTGKLAKLLASREERGGGEKHVVKLDGRSLPSSILLLFRAPRVIRSEG